MELAITKEINKEYLEAVKYYEEEISNVDLFPSLTCYIHLAFLYWCFTFELFEFVIPHGIPENWASIGGERQPKIIELGLRKYPNSIELNFWKRYFSHISFGEEFSAKDCERLIEEFPNDESKVPYFFLYLFDKEKYLSTKNLLIAECNSEPTAKNLYIKSVLS